MAVNEYTITIKNESGSPMRFMLFLERPTPNDTSPTGFYNNIWQTSPQIPSGNSTVRFKITDEYFAILGTNPTPLQPGTRPWTSSAVPVTLGPDGTSAFVTVPDDSPDWVSEKFKKDAPAGSFRIVTDSNFRSPNENNVFIGTGMRDPRHPESVIPVITTQAAPAMTFAFEVTTHYYITTGEQKKGEVVEEPDYRNILEVEFIREKDGTPYFKDAVFTYTAEDKYVADHKTGNEASRGRMRVQQRK